ncbi:MAG: FtsW/RodA/SpoVE family cell cycle protein, partial [Acutalibacteraceae bacterium]|nr:FtsW/RodA/SpoVE family cell cycle protein [Acutalibacteraceae bacterium]
MAHNYDFDTFTVGNKRAGRDEERPRASRQRAERTETVSENRKTVLGGKMSFFQKGKLDIAFLALVVLLMAIGLLCLFSSSYAYALQNYDDSYHFIKKQAIFTVLGFIGMYGASRINYHVYRRCAWAIYGVTIVMLIVVLIIPPISEDLNFHRWLYFGSFSFQPSEIAKFSIILLFSHL